jgi:hypothetical protein
MTTSIELSLLTWPDYINPLTLQQFEKEFGVAEGNRRREALWREVRG